MLVGFNTNISYKNRTFHVQTEDGGPGNPAIITLLYYQGAILASKKTSYAEALDDPDVHAKVSKLMKVQHKGVIRELLAGRYTEGLSVEENSEPALFNETEGIKIVKEVDRAETHINAGDIFSEDQPDSETEAQAGEQTAAMPEDTVKEKKQLTNGLDDILLNYIMKRAK